MECPRLQSESDIRETWACSSWRPAGPEQPVCCDQESPVGLGKEYLGRQAQKGKSLPCSASMSRLLALQRSTSDDPERPVDWRKETLACQRPAARVSRRLLQAKRLRASNQTSGVGQGTKAIWSDIKRKRYSRRDDIHVCRFAF